MRNFRGEAEPSQVPEMKAIADSIRGLMVAVINRALADLEKNSTAIKDEAMAWINSPDCEAFCDALDMDYTAVREKAAALYRRFLEETGSREKTIRKPRKSGASGVMAAIG
jgi:hypothetical protein